jgi:hypothetical protein
VPTETPVLKYLRMVSRRQAGEGAELELEYRRSGRPKKPNRNASRLEWM